MNQRIVVVFLSALAAACGDAPSFPELDNAAGACEPHWSLRARPLAKVPDANGDGVADLLTAPQEGPSRVELRSGRDGTLVWSRETAHPPSSAKFEDLDGDGTSELLVSTVVEPAQGECGDSCGSTGETAQFHLSALTLADGAARWARPPESASKNLNAEFVVIGDRDADGVRDLLLGAHYTSLDQAAPLQIVSGATGLVLSTLAPPADSAESFGEHLVALPDLDADGHPDVLVTDTRGPASRYAKGRVTAVSSATGAVLWERTGDAIDGALLYGEGLSTLTRPDSAIPDVLVGAHNSSAPDTEPQPGVMEVLDGRTGARRLLLVGRQGFEHFGIAVADVGDVDGDGVPDLGVGAPTPGLPVAIAGQGGRFAVHSGADGAVLLDVQEVIGEDAFSNDFGMRVFGLADRDAEDRSTLITESSVLEGNKRVRLTYAFRCGVDG